MSIGIKELQRERMLTEIITERDALILDLHADICRLNSENDKLRNKLQSAIMEENTNADSP